MDNFVNTSTFHENNSNNKNMLRRLSKSNRDTEHMRLRLLNSLLNSQNPSMDIYQIIGKKK